MEKFNYGDYLADKDFSDLTPKKEKEPEGDQVLEGAGSEGVMDLADAQLRSMAMGATLTWIEEGKYSFGAMDEFVAGVADLDGDDELSKEEEAIYTDLWDEVANAMLSLGADAGNVAEFLDDEDGTAGEKLGGFLSGIMDNMPSTDDEIVVTFATGKDGAVMECADGIEDMEDAILEASYKKVKVIRDGKVVIKRKRITGKVRLTAGQKAGLKKARRKAHSAAARLKRAKTARLRKAKGL